MVVLAPEQNHRVPMTPLLSFRHAVIHLLLDTIPSCPSHVHRHSPSHRSSRVPFTGSEAWTRSFGYKVVDEWRQWLVDGQVSGFVQGYDNNLTFLTIKLCHTYIGLMLGFNNEPV
ncbi:hypothetical protein L1987_18030 [Smallanthus sonchifolius]|uniref:Uncharacterized protein n=1 Tax=Smallanthus sonchifolius TaxID=185202 RepID=A0ACB9J0L6_9ASTR|nr:hypothetical protein L1987_18030 [Smallanthus sonchifolius]